MSQSAPGIPEGVSIEGVFLVEGRYTPEAAERRPPVRGAHLARLAALKREGILLEAGAYTDQLTSSLLILRVASEEAAMAIAREDIYVSAGVWGEISVRPFGRVSLGQDDPHGPRSADGSEQR